MRDALSQRRARPVKLPMKNKKAGVVSLGCDKNRVDTENMMYFLSDKDLIVTDDYSNADVIIINTCAFIENARNEAVETILEMAQYKKQNCKKHYFGFI